MKRFPLFAILALLSAPIVPAMAADVGVSISVGDPNFYGRIDLGDYPRPRLIYERPVIIERPAVRVIEEPLYLRVPPGHAKRWRYYCGRYGACGRQVYFVQDAWYRDVYVPRYHERHGDWHDRYDRDDWKHDRKEWKHDRKEWKHDRHDDHGHGHGRDRD